MSKALQAWQLTVHPANTFYSKADHLPIQPFKVFQLVRQNALKALTFGKNRLFSSVVSKTQKATKRLSSLAQRKNQSVKSSQGFVVQRQMLRQTIKQARSTTTKHHFASAVNHSAFNAKTLRSHNKVCSGTSKARKGGMFGYEQVAVKP